MPRTKEGRNAGPEATEYALRARVDGSLDLGLHGSKVTWDARLLPVLGFGDIVGLMTKAERLLQDW